MGSLEVSAWRLERGLSVRAWLKRSVTCGVRGNEENRMMVSFDGVVSGEIDIADVMTTEDGRVLWSDQAKRFVKEVKGDDGSVKYYSSWGGYSASFSPESYDRTVYYTKDDGSGKGGWVFYIDDKGNETSVDDDLLPVPGKCEDEAMTEEDIDSICD